jgi:hypothetical protein
MATKNLKLRIEDLVVYAVKMYIQPISLLWVWAWLQLLVLLTTVAVVIWMSSGIGWTPLFIGVFICWISLTGIYVVLLILRSWSRHIVDRRTH